MLGDKNAAATLAVSDLQRARDFYENTLGLSVVQETPGAVIYRSGSSTVLVYPSQFDGTNQATAAAWSAGDEFGAIVQALTTKGFQFEQYDDLPHTTREGPVHTMGDLNTVWFKDPDGNILAVGNQGM